MDTSSLVNPLLSLIVSERIDVQVFVDSTVTFASGDYNRNMHRTFLEFAGVTIVLLVHGGCREMEGPEPVSRPVQVVSVATVHREKVRDELTLIGRTEPWREATLYFEVAGVVEEVFVEEGDNVQANAPIARLELADFELAVNKAGAELEAAKANHDLLKEGTRKEDLDAAKADFAAAEALALYWTNESKRIETLHGTRTVTDSERERVRQQYEASLQRRNAAKARLDRAVEGPRKQEVAAAAAKQAAAEQALALAKRQLTKATLHAPFRGRIDKRLVDPGAYINVFPMGGVPVVHLVDLSRIDAVVSVPEIVANNLNRLRTIQVASASDESLAAKAEVVSLSKVADKSTGTYSLRLRIETPDGFRAGMVIVAKMPSAREDPSIRVPLSALGHAFGQKNYVYVVDPNEGIVQTRNVETGTTSGNQVEILGGLSEGEMIVVDSLDTIIPGDRVEIANASSG